MTQPPITANQIDTGTGVGSLVGLDSNALLPIQLSKISTGVFSGGLMTKGTEIGSPLTTTKINISAGSGIIVDNHTDPANPTYQLISWPSFTDVDITAIATDDRSFIAIGPAGSPSGPGVVLQQSVAYTHSQHRDYIALGLIGHANNTNIIAIVNNPLPAFDAVARLSDLAHSIGGFNILGNIYGFNGANLNLDKTSGESYQLGNNFHTDRSTPDVTSDPSESTLQWNYSYRDGSGEYNVLGKVTVIDPGFYDDGDGTLGTVSINSWTVQLIKHFPGGAGHRMEYGQTVFGAKADALAAIPDINHQHNPAFVTGIIRCYLVVRGGATDLSDAGDAQFIVAGKFSGAGGGSAGDVFVGFDDQATTLQITITDTETTFANRIDAEEVITEKRVTAAPTTAYTTDLTTGSVFKLTMGGNTAITFSNVPAAGLTTTITFMLIQDGTGTRVPSFPAAVLWQGGTAPTWSTASGEIDIITMFTDDGGTTWYANLVGQGYA